MKKRFLSILLSLCMCIGLFPTAAFASDTSWADDAVNTLNGILGSDVFQSSDADMTQGDAAAVLTAAGYDNEKFTQESNSALTRAEACEVLAVLFQLPVGESSAIQYLYEQGLIQGTAEGDLDETGSINLAQFAVVTYRLYSILGSIPNPPGEGGSTPEESGEDGDTSEQPSEGGSTPNLPNEGTGETGSFDGSASDWAKEELAKANKLGLIPDCLDGTDLTKGITRAEFAAVVVKVYEALSGTAAIPAINNPFTDCSDVEVLKAYNIGAVTGTSATTYQPDLLLNREQASAMLTRVFKKVSIVGWTLDTDSQFSLNYTKPAAFADDEYISDWAKDSVYFMAANGIINGVDNNKFAPRAITTEQQAQGYAQATREQALLIAVRMVENLGN